jgi:hypothetical protein
MLKSLYITGECTLLFVQQWSSFDTSRIVEGTAVLPAVSKIFGICPNLCEHVSYGDE